MCGDGGRSWRAVCGGGGVEVGGLARARARAGCDSWQVIEEHGEAGKLGRVGSAAIRESERGRVGWRRRAESGREMGLVKRLQVWIERLRLWL